MQKALYGLFWLVPAMIMTPIPAAHSKDVPVVAAPRTPARCLCTGNKGACPAVPTYYLPTVKGNQPKVILIRESKP